MQINRLTSGGLIDRNKPISFILDGKVLQGYQGDTLASALLANGVSIVSRSFKLHRPRGIVGIGAEEPNAIMQIGRGAQAQPNIRATQIALYEGLEARTTKGWPSVNFDLAAINDVFSRVFGAGFYYKTFMAPRSLWEFYEKFVRGSAGFGSVPDGLDPDHYQHKNAHCDVMVVGAGPSGLMAALAAARSGARVIIADEQERFGGNLLKSEDLIGEQNGVDWVASVVAELESMPNVTLLPRSCVFGYHDHNFLTIAERCTDHLAVSMPTRARQRQWRVRAKQVVLAQGAIERNLVFCNNDRPGVMMASAVAGYTNQYAVLPAKQVVVFTNNDSAYHAAISLAKAGAQVTLIDSRQSGAGDIAQNAKEVGVVLLPGHIITDVHGRRRVKKVSVARWDADPSKSVKPSLQIDCDLVAMSGGWSPAVHLHSHAGGKNVWDEHRLCFLPGAKVQANFSAGSGAGFFSLKECLKTGMLAGVEAARDCGFDAQALALATTIDRHSKPVEALWRVPAEQTPERCAKQFVDFQNDTSVADIRQAVREGYHSVEHVKRYTALGFGTDQGKLGNINGMAILAEALGKDIAAVGTTTFRPAYTPVTFGTIAGEGVGDLYEPVRKSAIHEAHVETGAPLEVVGQWMRPWYFPKGDEDLHAAVARECIATRNSVGMMDASTLGKIDVQGADAVTFLERMYTHDIARMKIGRCAYGIMLGEDGMVKDDGVMARLGEQHFYLTTTTGGAAAVLGWLEYWLQTEWPELDVRLTSLTDHYSTIAVVGPNSRKVLEKLGCDIDLSPEHFKFMDVRDATLGDLAVQLFRISFSGELAFEVNVSSNHALAMWRLLMDAGTDYDITPYGTETMHVLRAEKGFVIVGQDTDGSVNPVDLRMNWMLSKTKDYLGKRSLSREDSVRSDRKQLVGLRSVDDTSVLVEGAQLVENPNLPIPVPMCGHVTSSYYSACLQRPIAMALLAGGHARKGERVMAIQPGGVRVEVEVVSSVFYDPKGERQNG